MIFDTNVAEIGFFRQFARLAGVSDVPNLLLASNGPLWEVTAEGGVRNQGTILTLSPNNGSVLQTISFRGGNGGFPEGQLIQIPDGTIVGTTTLGGIVPTGSAAGVVSTLNANLPPPSKWRYRETRRLESACTSPSRWNCHDPQTDLRSID